VLRIANAHPVQRADVGHRVQSMGKLSNCCSLLIVGAIRGANLSNERVAIGVIVSRINEATSFQFTLHTHRFTHIQF
jgi:hypothetical protein